MLSLEAEVRLQEATLKIQDQRVVSDMNHKRKRTMGVDTPPWAPWSLHCLRGYLTLHFIIKKQIAIKVQQYSPRQINRCSLCFFQASWGRQLWI